MNGEALESGSRRVWYLLLLPLLPPLPLIVLAVWVWPRFDGLYGQDPYAYYGYLCATAWFKGSRGRLSSGRPAIRWPSPWFRS